MRVLSSLDRRAAAGAIGPSPRSSSTRAAAARLSSVRPRVALSSVEGVSIDDEGILRWDVLDAAASKINNMPALSRYTLRPGQKPASAPGKTLPTQPNAHKASTKPVIFFRDTNGWCPFCQRVWLALEEKGLDYDSVLIDLYDKPEWYQSMVPTNLVPAVNLIPSRARRDGNGGGSGAGASGAPEWAPEAGPMVVWESKDILLALESAFPVAPPLLPRDPSDRAAALAFIDALAESQVERAGFSFLTGGRLIGDAAPARPHGAELVETLKAAFLEKLAWLEGRFAARGGPFVMGAEFTLADVMCVSFMERLAAGLPKFRGLELRGSADFPAVAAWLAAMDARPAYQRVRSDDQTLQLLFARMMRGSTAAADAAALKWLADESATPGLREARSEAAAAVEARLPALVDAVVAGTGIFRYRANPYGATLISVNGRPPVLPPAVSAAVAFQFERVAAAARTGVPGPRADSTTACAMGAAAAAFLRARRAELLPDLSPAASEQLERACSRVLTQTFADHVDPMQFEPMVAPNTSSPLPSPLASPLSSVDEAAAAAVAAAAAAAAAIAAGGGGSVGLPGADPYAVEAALKIQRNREAILDDIATKSGLARPTGSSFGRTFVSTNGAAPRLNAAVRDAIDLHLRRLAGLLLTGSMGPKAEDAESAAIGAAALAFFRNRVSAPRDVSAGAAERLRAACDAVLRDIY